MSEHKPMTDEELAAIQGRLNAITQPPWKNCNSTYYGMVKAGEKDVAVASYFNSIHEDCRVTREDQAANAAFIANTPTDIARLLAENERLRSEVTRLDKEADWLVKMLSHYTEDCPLKFSWVYEEKFPIPKIDGCDGAWPDDDYFDCSNSTPEKCWREAARKAVEEEGRHG